MSKWLGTGNQQFEESPQAFALRGIKLLIEESATHQIRLSPFAYQKFRSAILRPTLQLEDPASGHELMTAVQVIATEFENYERQNNINLEQREVEWRKTVNELVGFIAEQDRIDIRSAIWRGVNQELLVASKVAEIETVREALLSILRKSVQKNAALPAACEKQDRSVTNDNAAGLRGGGAAIEHVRRMLENSRSGFVAIFKLSCLDVVGSRFGDEGIQDCLMSVSAFLSQNLHSDDTVYHWSESSLLAVCDRFVRQDILTAEFNRILARNREFTITISTRNIMLRIPIHLQIFPVSQFKTADELQNLTARTSDDRALTARAGIR